MDFPLVDFIRLPLARILWACIPMPPAVLEIRAQSLIVLKIPSIESSSMLIKKQDDNCCILSPLLNNVGVAWVYIPLDRVLYVSLTLLKSKLSQETVRATRIQRS